jgi:hypothetical protein
MNLGNIGNFIQVPAWDSVHDSVWGSVLYSVRVSVWGSVGGSIGIPDWVSVRDSLRRQYESK